MRRSSADTGGIFEAVPDADVQGSKSYIDVSMSAKRMSSRVKSVRNPVDVVISKFPGRESISLGSSGRPSGSPSGFGALDLLGFKLSVAAAVSVEVDVGQSSSMSSRAEEKLSFSGGRAGGESLVGAAGCRAGEVQKVSSSSSSSEAGVRQASRGVVLPRSQGCAGGDAGYWWQFPSLR